MIVQCCVCHKVRLGRDWVEPPQKGTISEASHGYCPVCEAKVYESLREHLQEAGNDSSSQLPQAI